MAATRHGACVCASWEGAMREQKLTEAIATVAHACRSPSDRSRLGRRPRHPSPQQAQAAGRATTHQVRCRCAGRLGGRARIGLTGRCQPLGRCPRRPRQLGASAVRQRQGAVVGPVLWAQRRPRCVALHGRPRVGWARGARRAHPWLGPDPCGLGAAQTTTILTRRAASLAQRRSPGEWPSDSKPTR